MQDKPRIIRRKIPIRPRFHETDMMGVIHNSEYLRWFEEGRLQIMMEVLPMEDALKLAVATPVVRNVCDYLRAVKFGMPLVLITTHEIQSGYEGRLVFEHCLVHEKQKTEMARGESVITLVSLRTQQLVKTWPEMVWERYQLLR